jgi:hypothetical protein
MPGAHCTRSLVCISTRVVTTVAPGSPGIPARKPPDGQITTRREQIPLVSRTRCSVLHAAPQSRDPQQSERHVDSGSAAHRP